MMRIVFHRPADFFWTLTKRPRGPVTCSESRSPTEVGDRRAAFQPTTFVDRVESSFTEATTERACDAVADPDENAGSINMATASAGPTTSRRAWGRVRRIIAIS
jgi:hypothetical protein